MRDLARQLLAIEAAASSNPGNATDAHPHEAVRVCGKLRVSLTRFAGPEGFASLLRRALTLARVEAPALQSVSVKPDGTLDGLEQLVVRGGAKDAAEAITGTLLSLLVTFIGESLTLRLVRDAWPEASFDREQALKKRGREDAGT